MKNSFCLTWLSVFFFALLTFSLSARPASGAGFAITEQSVSGLGNAFAGGAAIAQDASTIFYNPAGLVRIPGFQLVAGSSVIVPSFRFDNEGSTHASLSPLAGNSGGDARVTKGVPNLYLSQRVSDRLTLGLGINSPFGLASDYDNGWVGRYYALDSDMFSLNINPAAAYRINDKLSIGAGLNFQYMKAELSQAVDFGLIGYSFSLGLLPTQSNDGKATMKGDSWGYGFDLGLLYEFSKDTRAGLAYRSRIKQKLRGDVNWNVDPQFSAAVAALPQADPRYSLNYLFKNGNIKADVTLPDSLSLSLFHRYNEKWAVMADVTWTNWSLFHELRVDFSNPDPDYVVTTDWKDTLRYSTGVNYAYNHNLVLKGGVAYDPTPVRDASHATPRIPDGDRYWLAAGLSYKYSDRVNFDFGYTHIFVSNPEIDKPLTDPENTTKGELKGTYTAHVNIMSAQLRLNL